MSTTFVTFLEGLGALQLAIPPPPVASWSSEASARAECSSTTSGHFCLCIVGTVSGIAVSVGGDVLLFASVLCGSTPPVSPIPRPPVSPASSTNSTTSHPSTPMAPSVATPGTEPSVPVEIDHDGGTGHGEATSPDR
ncbi:unnamed protein product [Phytophthora fragariaefolia]|uniref:Unnamed protein product n=1 Tax=Phytophthora fragariaefolia TaxID=1490495 RepID=A0A9W6YEP8_9STRA|nr:unnamed protein product [Phytophthora fragariaefolia]